MFCDLCFPIVPLHAAVKFFKVFFMQDSLPIPWYSLCNYDLQLTVSFLHCHCQKSREVSQGSLMPEVV